MPPEFRELGVFYYVAIFIKAFFDILAAFGGSSFDDCKAATIGGDIVFLSFGYDVARKVQVIVRVFIGVVDSVLQCFDNAETLLCRSDSFFCYLWPSGVLACLRGGTEDVSLGFLGEFARFEEDVFCICAAFGKEFALCVGGCRLATLGGGTDALFDGLSFGESGDFAKYDGEVFCACLALWM